MNFGSRAVQPMLYPPSVNARAQKELEMDNGKNGFHTINLVVDRPNKRVFMYIDGKGWGRQFSILGGPADAVDEFDPRFFSTLVGGLRFYPARESWRDSARHLGKLLTRHLGLALSSFEENRSRLASAGNAQDIAIIFEGFPNSLEIPFELLLDSTEQTYLVCEHPFYRRVTPPVTQKHPGFINGTKAADLRVLVIKSSVHGPLPLPENGETVTYHLGELAGIDQEVDMLKKRFPSLTLIPSDPGIWGKKRRAPTIEEIANCLKTEWDIVHFVGHGVYRHDELSGIVISGSGESGDPLLLESNRLAELFRPASVKFVFLSSCEGALTGATPSRTLYSDFDGVINGLLKGNVGTVLAHRWPVSDAVAGLLADQFYEAMVPMLPFNGPNPELLLACALQCARSKMFVAYPKENAWLSTMLIFSVQETELSKY